MQRLSKYKQPVEKCDILRSIYFNTMYHGRCGPYLTRRRPLHPPLQDLEEFVEGSGDDGFIVFTLGSMVSDMPKKKAKQFLDAFRQIPQRVTR